MNKGVPAGQMALEYASNRTVPRRARNSRISMAWVEVPDSVDSLKPWSACGSLSVPLRSTQIPVND